MRGASAGAHVGLAVPEAEARLLSEISVDGDDALLPHLEAVAVAEDQPTLEQVFVEGIDAAADGGSGVGPVTGFDVDAESDEIEGRPALP